MDKESKNLALKTLAGFISLIVIMGILIFISAGSLNYPEGWIYLFILTLSSLLITIYLWVKNPKLLERRVKAGPAAEKEKSQKLIQFFAQFSFIAFIVFPSLDHHYKWSYAPLFIIIAGDVLVALGFYIVFLVFKENTYAASIIEVRDNQKVITTGLYAYIRHPMYMGGLVMLAGTPLALGSWWGLLMLVPITFVFIIRLLYEEKFLLNNLNGYKEYCQKVRYRLIPFVW
jgi:protein-S-isoprenylcysteine O-methyltransferase Ste14